MKELQELRNEVLSLRNMGELTKQTESILLHKLNTLQESINYTRCCKVDSEQLFDFLEWFDNYCTVDIKPNKEDVELYLSK